MIQKPFSQESYDKHNKRGIDAVRRYLDKNGYFTHVQENYGVDIVGYKPESHEVEIKAIWEEGEWPPHWRDVHIPARKGKLVAKNRYFWVVSNDLKLARRISSRELKQEYIRSVANREVPSGEEFYCVPVERTELISLEG